MKDLLHHPRVRALLLQAADAHRLRQDLAPHAEPSAELDAAIRSIFHDLGRAVYELASVSAPLIPEAADDETGHFTSEIDADEVGAWYADEAEPPEPTFGDPDDDAPPADDAPEDPVDPADLVSVLHLRARQLDPTDALGALTSAEAPPWAARVRELLDFLDLPSDPTDPQELSVEAARVQWAAGELERLAGLPESVQLAILGLLGARCQHLRAHVDVAVGPNLALDRLRRYRRAAGLPPVHGLAAEARPIGDAWIDDARELWLLLGGGAR